MMHPRLLPILFNTDMIFRVLSGDKTETRRVIKPQPIDTPRIFRDSVEGVSILAHVEGKDSLYNYYPPYNIGDILYVRETWQKVYDTEVWDDPRRYIPIREMITNFDDIPKVEAGMSTESSTRDMPPRMKYYVYKASDIQYSAQARGLIWCPSIHMPREAARIFLKVTDVKIERLQDITVAGILNEGITDIEPPPICKSEIVYPDGFPKGFDTWDKEKREEWIQNISRARYIGWCDYADNLHWKFKEIWQKTISKSKINVFGYDANPWVAAITFERIEKAEVNLNAFN